MKRCLNCGNEMEDNAQLCGKCGEAMQEMPYVPERTKSKKKSGATIGIISTIIFILIGRAVGGYIGKNIGKNISEKNEINKLDAYIESTDYVPGTLDDEKYSSSHFGFQFETDDNWTMYTKSELVPMSEEIKKSTFSGAVATLEKEGASDEMIEKWKETVYAEVEMGAAYVVDDMIAGEASVAVFSGYGMDQVSSGELVDAMKKELMKSSGVVDSGATLLAGESYDYVKISVSVDGMDLRNQLFIREKDDMICMIACKAITGYEDEVLASFKKQLRKYAA